MRTRTLRPAPAAGRSLGQGKTTETSTGRRQSNWRVLRTDIERSSPGSRHFGHLKFTRRIGAQGPLSRWVDPAGLLVADRSTRPVVRPQQPCEIPRAHGASRCLLFAVQCVFSSVFCPHNNSNFLPCLISRMLSQTHTRSLVGAASTHLFKNHTENCTLRCTWLHDVSFFATTHNVQIQKVQKSCA